MCAAPKGNKFWLLRSKHGRDRLFATPDLLWEAACEYFQWCIDNPLMAVEQTKARPYKDGKEMIVPDELIEMPKMRPFTLHGLCLYLDANTDYFNDFADSLKGKSDEISIDFSRIIKRIRETIYSQQFEGASAGFLNPNIIARNLGLTEKLENKTEVRVDNELKDLIKKFIESND